MGPTQSKTNQMGLSPIKNMKNFWPKSVFPTPFSKNPKSSKPRQFSVKSKKRMKWFKKTYLRDDFALIELDIYRVFEWKIVWDWKRHKEGTTRETKVCLKICHISPLKLKTHAFHGLHTCEVTCEVTREKCIISTKPFAGSL